ncbi:MAG: radical SAM family heme chaperone HemW [Xanthomonadales bacterium]|nr:radical SAM family heme chaperone HemW [Xanthomonadales bacterium]NIX11610.1 radical SAM family heme chaperone HemW [Xanthomonadales bacterium]
MISPAEDLPLPPLGLYVHLPWCVNKCPYCDFNSHELRGELPADKYLAALLEDLEQDQQLAAGRPVSSVYFGGGTPSLFRAAHIAALLAGFRACLDLAPGAEISLEANPGTVEHDSFEAYAEAGINRLSLGVQSFDDKLLQAIGRIHGVAEAEEALASLRRSAITNFNVDLMYGLPGQSVEQAVADVAAALAAGAPHISHYQLTLEPNTAFAVNPPELPGEEAIWVMQEAAGDLLQGAGYENYEISAWAKPGSACRHNLNYWCYGDFLGIGAGAHAKLTGAGHGVVRRMSKQRHPRAYLAGNRIAEDRQLGRDELVFEFFLNRLRLREGFTREAFTARTGLDWSEVSERVEGALDRGLLESHERRFRPTGLGWRFVNDLQAIFLPPSRV